VGRTAQLGWLSAQQPTLTVHRPPSQKDDPVDDRPQPHTGEDREREQQQETAPEGKPPDHRESQLDRPERDLPAYSRPSPFSPSTNPGTSCSSPATVLLLSDNGCATIGAGAGPTGTVNP